MSDQMPSAEKDAPDAYMAPNGSVWINLRKHPSPGGVYDATPASTPLWFSPIPPAKTSIDATEETP